MNGPQYVPFCPHHVFGFSSPFLRLKAHAPARRRLLAAAHAHTCTHLTTAVYRCCHGCRRVDWPCYCYCVYSSLLVTHLDSIILTYNHDQNAAPYPPLASPAALFSNVPLPTVRLLPLRVQYVTETCLQYPYPYPAYLPFASPSP
ncbi:hypothetical protein DENSPDRAFT_431845 [Dentipellis sp. KUC8613]|nr:hypothetical protein DENSPDRAFT_431845 [Dentipellis sp. KUC8613]